MENDTTMLDSDFGAMIRKVESLDSNYVKLTEIFREQHPIGRTKPVIRRFLRGVFKRVVTKEEVSNFMITLVAQQLYDDAKEAERLAKNEEFKQLIFEQMRERNRTFEGITADISDLQQLKWTEDTKKDINKKINKLNIIRQSLKLFYIPETTRDRWGLPLKQKKNNDEVNFEAPTYTYEPEQKKKTGSGTQTEDRTKKRNEIVTKRVKKNRKW